MADFISTPKGAYNLDAIAVAEPMGDGRISLTLFTGQTKIVPDPDGSLWKAMVAKKPSPPAVVTKAAKQSAA